MIYILSLSVLGSGRWGSLITWYLNKIHHKVTIWGKDNTSEIKILKSKRTNGVVLLEPKIDVTSDIEKALSSEYIVISINSQNLRSFFEDLVGNHYKEGGFYNVLKDKKIILCMKGIEEKTGKRLTEVVKDYIPTNSNVAVWVGPGHVKSLLSGVRTCMVIDSINDNFKKELAKSLNSQLIRCYYGNDLIGTEVGAASKNVIGIGAGILDALNMGSLKGALMARGADEISRLITAMGGSEKSAYGLCHLGDYEATLFSNESNNRKFGESLVTKEKLEFVSEGIGTAFAINNLSKKLKINLPICEEILNIINGTSNPEESISKLFSMDISFE